MARAASLPASECHVWLLFTSPDERSSPAAGDWALLDAQERAACERLRGAGLRARYTRAHAALRRVLSRYAPVAPADWRFARSAERRPSIAAPAALAGVDFNLSYAPAVIALALAREARVGIDVESAPPGFDPWSVAPRVLSPREREALAAVRGDGARRELFHAVWVLKEALAKADGEGLGLPFADMTLLPAAGGVIGCDLAAVGEDAQRWQFALASPCADHALGLALRDAAPRTLRAFHLDAAAGAVERPLAWRALHGAR